MSTLTLRVELFKTNSKWGEATLQTIQICNISLRSRWLSELFLDVFTDLHPYLYILHRCLGLFLYPYAFLSRLIVSKLQSSDILFILGDHGMTRSGDHGGDSDAELEAAFIVFTANQSSLVIKDDSENQTNRRLHQIDLVPTLSLLTNVPIPYSNLGILYDHLLGYGANLHQGMVLNFIQVNLYPWFTANDFINLMSLYYYCMYFVGPSSRC